MGGPGCNSNAAENAPGTGRKASRRPLADVGNKQGVSPGEGRRHLLSSRKRHQHAGAQRAAHSSPAQPGLRRPTGNSKVKFTGLTQTLGQLYQSLIGILSQTAG
jgi:hypothetical protein